MWRCNGFQGLRQAVLTKYIDWKLEKVITEYFWPKHSLHFIFRLTILTRHETEAPPQSEDSFWYFCSDYKARVSWKFRHCSFLHHYLDMRFGIYLWSITFLLRKFCSKTRGKRKYNVFLVAFRKSLGNEWRYSFFSN